jgi:RNA polymerase sigma-70 factor (ECF subfamily)
LQEDSQASGGLWRLADKPDIRELIERLYPRIHRAALAMTRNPCEADDLAQETILQALRSWPKFAGKSRADTWVFAILIHMHQRHARAHGRIWRRLQVWFFRQKSRAAECDPAVTVEDREWKSNVWRLVARLPLAQQHAVVLRYCEDLSYEQLADVLQCPLGTVKSRLHQGLASLKAMLELESTTAADTRRVTSASSR